MSEDVYYGIFDDLIGKHLRDSLIYRYDAQKNNHEYTPFRHHYDPNTERLLGEFMRKYIFMYAYSESEVIKANEKGRLRDLEKAAKFALEERLPRRKGASNGLYSELLLDLLITLYTNNVNKLATRAIYRQHSDNQEIKGYDGLHISVDSQENKNLWLGQAKMGRRSYCVSDIKKDLNGKANMLYTADQLFFIADKEERTLPKALELLEMINDVSWDNRTLSIDERATKLSELFEKENVNVFFICLLAYDRPSIYELEDKLDNEILEEIKSIQSTYEEEFKDLISNEYEVLLWVIPIRDLQLLRESMGI
ncbi:Hachiman antiphage defense system protein HamA [Oceanobacillus kapialis]|uniref:Hachiman antiphage defense system protein HamA n=1 Tax=Oceanobacillus kapialis TaxID=481353 RepID=UPI0038504392